MKKIFFYTGLMLMPLFGFSQTTSTPAEQNISTDDNVRYRLFATKNIYNFIKLDTSNGKMWQVQWGIKKNETFETILSNVSLVDDSQQKNGRFFIYPTTNTYNFILLDQIDGRAWQVQWSFDEKERLLERIK